MNNGVLKEKSLNSLSSILWQSVGNTSSDVDEEAAENIVDCPQQVDILLSIATDPNVLVRQWIGLLPWI